DSVSALRRENAQLCADLNELQGDSGLRDDQVLVLKQALRDVEASLLREREFNAENRRINADYLANILTKFLMSTEPSERAKLVPVLCQLLHLRPEETRVIVEKWAVRGGGLVGWLLPPRAASSGGGGGGKGDDLSYDSVTGGGIDVNSY
ncbi:hypothetical protein B484DRAFT_437397, partial [Ochromonadaceae sp. CCMP2298]